MSLVRETHSENDKKHSRSIFKLVITMYQRTSSITEVINFTNEAVQSQTRRSPVYKPCLFQGFSDYLSY